MPDSRPDSSTIYIQLNLSEYLGDGLLRFWHDGTDYDKADIYVPIGANWIISWVKLEVGKHATAYSPKSYSQELADCQRYYQVYNTMRLRACFVSTNRFDCTLQLVTRMRTNPEVSTPYIAIQTLSGVVQSDFTFTYYNETDNIRILGTKSSHGLTDGSYINTSGSIFLIADAEINNNN